MALSKTRRMKTPAGKVVNAIVKAVKPKKTLAKKVTTLARQVKKLNKVSYEKCITTSPVATGYNLTADYNVWNLSRLNPQSAYSIPIFGKTGTEMSEVNKAYLNQKDIYVSIRQASEPNLVRMSMFLVSLKDQAATTTVFDPASRQLVLTPVTDYVGLSEQVMLNPNMFTIHASRRFTMGYEGAAGPTADTYSQRRFKFTIKPRQKLIENPVGNVFNNSIFASPMDPSQNYFIIIFNDNASLDLEFPKVDINVYDHWALPN